MKKKSPVERKNSIPWYADEYRGPQQRNKMVKDYLSLTPREIKTMLEENVVNQDEACKKIAIMMYQHFQGHRFVGMLAGPTGSGKSFIAENLRKNFPDIVYIRDVSNVTEEGWKGEKKVSTLFEDIRMPYSYAGKINPLIFFDESDKLFAPKTSSSGENYSEAIQAEFLTLIHGGTVKLSNKQSSFPDVEGPIILDTSNMSFLFAGAFEKRARLVAENESVASIGFGASHEKLQSYNRELTMEDIHEAGCITELCGRIQKIVCLNKFREKDFMEMLNETNRGPIYEMEQEFNIPIHISSSKKEEIAHKAYTTGYGVRGIKNTIREYIDELMWDDCKAKILEIE